MLSIASNVVLISPNSLIRTSLARHLAVCQQDVLCVLVAYNVEWRDTLLLGAGRNRSVRLARAIGKPPLQVLQEILFPFAAPLLLKRQKLARRDTRLEPIDGHFQILIYVMSSCYGYVSNYCGCPKTTVPFDVT